MAIEKVKYYLLLLLTVLFYSVGGQNFVATGRVETKISPNLISIDKTDSIRAWIVTPAEPPFNPNFDNNAVAVYDFTDTDNVVKDGSNYVSQVDDLSGNENHLTQDIGSYQPLWSAEGIAFDGLNDVLSNTLNVSQPFTIYFVGVVPSSGVQSIFGGNGYTRTSAWMDLLAHKFSSPNIITYSSPNPTNTNKVMVYVFNGANSSIQYHNQPAKVGDVGTQGTNGVFYVGRAVAISYTSSVYKEIIIRQGADSEATREAIKNYLYEKHNITP